MNRRAGHTPRRIAILPFIIRHGSRTVPDYISFPRELCPSFAGADGGQSEVFGSKGDPSNLNDGDETAEEGRGYVFFSPRKRKIQKKKKKEKKLERRGL